MTTLSAERVRSGTTMPIRDVSLFVKVVGRGDPLLLMHGGPGADHTTMLPFRRLADRFTLVFYDHRCNGRSTGAPSSMTWENLTADAEALRQRLGFERWAVLGHSFGGHVALEYALRYPDRLSHLVLLDTGGDSHWARQNALELLAERGYSEKVELVRRWFSGEFAPRVVADLPADQQCVLVRHQLVADPPRGAPRRVALQAAAGGADLLRRHLLPGWTVMDRLGEITVPTLVMAGRATVPAGVPARAGGRDPRRQPAYRRARRPQSGPGAAGRGHGGRQRLPLYRRRRAGRRGSQ